MGRPGRGALMEAPMGLRREAPHIQGGDGSAVGVEPMDARVLRFVRRAGVVGLAVSLLVHMIAWFIAGNYWVAKGVGGTSLGVSEAVEVAVLTSAELAQATSTDVSFDSPSVPELQPEELPAVEDLSVEAEESSAAGTLDDLLDTGLGEGAGDLGEGIGLGEGAGTGGGSASFFGAEATGTRFAYIVDVSGSMAVGGKLQTLQAELARSIEGLTEAADFLVVTYSSGAMPLEGRSEWVDADERGKRFARRAIGALEASGGTNPSPAFTLAFAMKPRPDAVYFMTDGEFSEEVAGEIAMLNAELKAPIHCIAFVSRESEALMRRIAHESGGSYTFVPASGGGRP